MDYKAAGVDIDAANDVVDRVKRLARTTFTDGVLSDIGAFGGLFRPELGGMDEPVLVASADGVGTKLKVAFAANEHTFRGRGGQNDDGVACAMRHSESRPAEAARGAPPAPRRRSALRTSES